MTPDPRSDAELNRIINDWMGLKKHESGTWEDEYGAVHNGLGNDERKQFCSDLNACAVSLLHLNVEQRERFVQIVCSIEKDQFLTVFQQTQQAIKLAIATPHQLAEALVKVIEEGKA